MDGIIQGTPADEIMMSIKGQVRIKKGGDIRQLLEQSLSVYALMQLRYSLEVLRVLDAVISYLTKVSSEFAREHYPCEYKILLTVPGVGEIAAFRF